MAKINLNVGDIIRATYKKNKERWYIEEVISKDQYKILCEERDDYSEYQVLNAIYFTKQLLAHDGDSRNYANTIDKHDLKDYIIEIDNDYKKRKALNQEVKDWLG